MHLDFRSMYMYVHVLVSSDMYCTSLNFSGYTVNVCVYTYIYNIHTCMYVHRYMCACACTDTDAKDCKTVCVYCIHVSISISIYIYIYIYVIQLDSCVVMYICMNYTYIHTSIHILYEYIMYE